MKCKEKILEILKKLISFKTSKLDCKEAIRYIEEILLEYNFRCEIKNFGEDEIPNLYGIHGKSRPQICFAGHVDVVDVPDFAAWRFDPFKLNIWEGHAYGRGIADMKAALACSICAAIDFIKLYPKRQGSISFLITGDEEGVAENGTKKMIKYIAKRYPAIDLCILGEPTSEKHIGDIVKIARRGSINFKLKITDKERHVAYPESDSYALQRAIKIATELLSFNASCERETNLVITNIYTDNMNENVITGNAYINFNIRFSSNFSPKMLEDIIKEIIKKHTDNFELKARCNSLPFRQEKTQEMIKFTEVISEITGIEAKFSNAGGTSDARFIQEFAAVIEFGLLSNQAHKVNENASLEDIEKLYECYFRYLEYFFLK